MNNLNTNSINNPTTKGLITDLAPHLQSKEIWTYARNSVLNSHNGNIYALQNEPSNSFCVELPYTFIGSIPLINDRFAIFTTDNINSEIGIFDSKNCSYSTIVNDSCLGFNTSYLVSGKSKYNNYDCSEIIYWADSGLNPRRYINTDPTKIPKVITGYVSGTCSPTYGDALDCNKLRIDPYIKVPYIDSELSNNGVLKNGTYQFAIAYSIKKERITDIYSFTNPVSVFSHANKISQGVHLSISNLDNETFDEFELFVAYTIDNYTTYKSLGFYPINESLIDIYSVERPEYTAITSDDIFIKKDIFEKAEWCEGNDQYLLWGKLTKQVDINYQLTAMNIIPNYVIVEAPPTHYRNGGKNIGYYGDEIYAYGIQWLRANGSYTDVYHIPGTSSGSATTYADYPSAYMDVYESGATCVYNDIPPVYYVYNTASRNGQFSTALSGSCDLIATASGTMAYWQSTSLYPDNSDMFGSFACQPIRHHKFPNEKVEPRYHPANQSLSGTTGNIRIKTIKFSNIEHPKDANGNYLTDVVGYRIVRSDRTGNKTIIARGYSTNMRSYNEYIDPYNPTQLVDTIYYPNYPYNDLNIDPFLGSYFKTNADVTDPNYSNLSGVSYTKYTFYSPHTLIKNYALGTEVLFEADESGVVSTNFKNVYHHPKYKLLSSYGTDAALVIAYSDLILQILDKVLVLVGASFVGVGIGATTLLSDMAFGFPKMLAQAAATSQTFLETVSNFWKWQDYVVQGDSVCTFNNSSYRTSSNGFRRNMTYYSYLGDGLTTIPYTSGEYISNFKKPEGVYFSIQNSINSPSVTDNSRNLMGASGTTVSYTSTASVYYTSMKRRIDNAYGTLDSINYINTDYEVAIPELPIGANPTTAPVFYSTDAIFGGDCFINKFSINQPQPFFNDYPLNQPNGSIVDYRNYKNIAYPTYWLDSSPFTVMDSVYGILPTLTDVLTVLGGGLTPSGGTNPITLYSFPSSRHYLDDYDILSIAPYNFILPAQNDSVHNQMYASYNGTAILYVESDFNLEYRDFLSETSNVYTINSNLDWIYRSDNLFTPEEFIYDMSYSKQNTEVYAVQQDVAFNLSLSLYCNPYYPNAIIYSLPAADMRQDHWLYYLRNNIYTFPINDFGNLVSFHNIDNQQIIFFFDKAGPYVSIGRDELQTQNGIKVTIGDAGLFARPPRPLEYTDYGFGSSTSRFAFKATAYGNYYASINQGKIFQQSGMKLKDISKDGNKYWFSEYLPSNLIAQFPNFKDYDNPVVGTGVICTYDPIYETYILTEKDYKCLNPQIKYNEEENKFYLNEQEVFLKESKYFEDASWTISYKADLGVFVSWHDYHPIGFLQGNRHFMSIKGNDSGRSSIYKHNEINNSYCNFYDVDYPFAIQLPINNQANIETIKSIEFFAETYVYTDKLDYFHVLDTTFDYALISNSEQVSGWLHLNSITRNKVSQQFLYPFLSGNQYEIKIDKVENKYRFNQFWDITKDRGEYSGAQIPLLLTQSNGYIFDVNPLGVDYNKPQTQRKKFRHKTSKLYLEKEVSANNKITLHFSDTKQTNSPR